MIVRRLTVSLLLGTIYLLILCIDKAEMSSRNGRKLSRSHFEFSIDLYRQLSEDCYDKNCVFSPYSVNSVLSMLFLGTSSFSNSSRQLRQTLHFDNISYVDVHKSFKEIVKNFDDIYYKSKLQMTNGVFYQVQTVLDIRRDWIQSKKQCTVKPVYYDHPWHPKNRGRC
jgi:serine protease inhibitor